MISDFVKKNLVRPGPTRPTRRTRLCPRASVDKKKEKILILIFRNLIHFDQNTIDQRTTITLKIVFILSQNKIDDVKFPPSSTLLESFFLKFNGSPPN